MTDAQRDALLGDRAAFDAQWAPYKVNVSPDQIAQFARGPQEPPAPPPQ